MTLWTDLPTPALLVDLDKLESNIDFMSRRARALGVTLRPHIKTHKCVEIARLQQEAGCQGLTVSTLHEAEVFADHGFEDLTWAFPVIFSRLPQIETLAERITLRLLVDSEEAVDVLEQSGFPFHVWVKVDCGYHRAGVDPSSPQATEVVRRLATSRTLTFDGILTHSGQAYHAGSRRALEVVAEQERRVMVGFAESLRAKGWTVPQVSVGSTPAMAAVQSLAGVDEARPGNYVYYDKMQVDLGSCQIGDCALTVLASVVSSQPGGGHCVVDAGALALSKDPGLSPSADDSLGSIFEDYGHSALRQECRVTALSQEHGIVDTRLPVGERVRILPNHSCLTVACFDELFAVRGDRVEGCWKIWRGR